MSKIVKPVKKAANSLLFSLFSGNSGPKSVGYNGSLSRFAVSPSERCGFVAIGATVLAGASHLAPTAIVDRLPSLPET
jgi:hypothetical protein